ncbi:MAG: PAS domain S-box protein, partial [Deltaproteobacteria bacterium]|nr:PAS domain S-box protein [Deltaproteobacteria bacterium]
TKEELIGELKALKMDNMQLASSLEEMEEKHNLFYEKSLIPMFITSIDDGNILDVNKRGVDFSGYSSKEELLEEYVPGEQYADPNGRKELLNELKLKGEIYKKEHKFITKDGTPVWVEFYAKAYPDKGWLTSIMVDITKRKKAENELRKTKDHLDNIIESSLDGIIVSDSMGYVTRVNNSFLKLIGYNEEELIGKHTVELTPYEEGTYDSTTGEMVEIDEKFIVDATEIAGNKLFEAGKISNWKSYYLRKDGKTIPVESNIAYLYNDEGETIGAIGVSSDITERRQIEMALRKSHQELEEKVKKRTATLKLANEQLQQEITNRKWAEEKLIETRDHLENIIESSLDSIVVTDNKGYITRANKAFLQLLGYSEEGMIGKHMVELSPTNEGIHESTTGELIQINEEFFNAAKTSMSRLIEKGKIHLTMGYHIRKDNKLVPVEDSIVYLHNKERERTGAVGIIRDITERKRAEETLRKSEERYENLIERANDAIISINKDGVIMGFNKRAEEMFGYSREEMFGKPGHLLAPPQKRENQKKMLEKFKAGELSDIDKNILEGKGLKKDGQEFPAEFSSYILEFDGEQIATTILRDISERKEAEKKVVEYQKRLKSLTSQMTLTEEKERKQFADYLHDQIGQELFAIKMKLERLKDSLSSNEDVKILSGLSNSLIGTINNTRSLTFELSPPILYQLGLEAALEWLAEHTYEQYNIVVSFEDDKQEKPLDEDVKIFLYRAVRELLTNVAKHAQTQNAKVSIEKDIAHIKICVEDNGVGFTPSSKHSSKEKGFGLFSIKERLDYLGGELEIGSQPGRGTRATLIAPLKGQ